MSMWHPGAWKRSAYQGISLNAFPGGDGGLVAYSAPPLPSLWVCTVVLGSDFRLAMSPTLTVNAPAAGQRVVSVQLPEALFVGTAPAGSVLYSSPGASLGLKDQSSPPNALLSIGAFNTIDRAHPVIAQAVLRRARSTPGGGDTVDVRFSEDVNQLFNDETVPENTFRFELPGAPPTDLTSQVYYNTGKGLSFGPQARSLVTINIGTGSATGKTQLQSNLHVIALQDINDAPGTGQLADAQGNRVEVGNRVTLEPPGPPLILAANTYDNDRDGFVDHVRVVLDQPVDDSSYRPFDGTGQPALSITGFDLDPAFDLTEEHRAW